jgi:two-component system, OmpR family, response regulator
MLTVAASPLAVAPIALFEPDMHATQRIQTALAPINRAVLTLDDPAQTATDWVRLPFALALINPFRSALAPDAATRLARDLAGDRPVLALTLTDSARQRALAIGLGADDAMCASGSGVELAARVAALLRRSLATIGLIRYGDLEIDLIQRIVWRAGVAIPMPAREFELLVRLARARGRVVPRAQLFQSVWRIDFDPGTNRIEVHVSRLRSRIDTGHRFAMLRTVKGVGYMLAAPSNDHAVA